MSSGNDKGKGTSQAKFSSYWKKHQTTVYVSKEERSRLLRNLKEGLDTKVQKSNMCRVTQELTIILMKLTKMKAQFSDMEQTENNKHITLRKMMDLVRDDICSLLRKENVTREEVALVVNRTHDVEKLMGKMWNKIVYEEEFLNIEVQPDEVEMSAEHRPSSSGDEDQKGFAKTTEDIKNQEIEKQKADVGDTLKTTDGEVRKKFGVKTIDMNKNKIYDIKEDTERSPRRSDADLYLKSKSKVNDTPKKKRQSGSDKFLSSEKSSYPHGYKDVNIRKDEKSFHNIGFVTTTAISNEDSEDSKTRHKKKIKTRKKKNKSILTNTLVRSECLGTESNNIGNVNIAHSIHTSKTISLVADADMGLKSSCIVNKLSKKKPRNELRNSSFLYNKRTLNPKLKEKESRDDTETSPKMLNRSTSYDDFILDPNFSWEGPKLENISKRRYVIDQKSWRFVESYYDSDLNIRPVLKTVRTHILASSRPRKDISSQTEKLYPDQIHQVCFMRIFYTNSYFGYFMPSNKVIPNFLQGTTIIDKSKDNKGTEFVTCRTDLDKGIAHFTLIQNSCIGNINDPEASAVKLNQVKDTWLQQIRDFFLLKGKESEMMESIEDCCSPNNIQLIGNISKYSTSVEDIFSNSSSMADSNQLSHKTI